MYDAADSILAQKISQIEGVGQVHIWGSSRPAVRVQVNPDVMNNLGIGITDVAAALQGANAHQAKGDLTNGDRRWQLNTTDELFKADEYANLAGGLPQRRADPVERHCQRGGLGGRRAQRRVGEWPAHGAGRGKPATGREHYRSGGPGAGGTTATGGVPATGDSSAGGAGPHDHDPRVGA